MNANEPLMKRRENLPLVKTVGLLLPKERVQRLPVYWLCGKRRKGGMICI